MGENIDEFLELLQSGNKKERRHALEGLKKIGKPASLQLLNILNSDSPEVRDAAAEALGAYSAGEIETFFRLLVSGKDNAKDGAARTIGYIAGSGANISPSLTKAIRDGGPEERKGAALSIGYIPRPGNEHINMLLYLLKDDDREVREQSANSLKRIKWSSKNPSEMSFFFLAEGELDELGKIGRPALEAIRFGLDKGSLDERVRLTGHLGRIGGAEAVKILISLLNNPEKRVRLAAIDAISDTGDPQLIDFLVAVMDDPDYEVRVEASWSLRKAGWKPQNQHEKVKALILRGDFREIELMGVNAIPYLIENLGDEIPNIRKDTIKILYTIGKPAHEALLKAKNSADPAITEGIAEALDYFRLKTDETGGLLGGGSVDEEEIHAYNSKEYWYNSLTDNNYNPGTAERLSGALSDTDDIIRIAAVETLKSHGKKAIPVLVLLLNDDKSNVRTAAIESLGDLYAKDAIEPLMETIEDPDSQVRKASAYALGKIRDKATLPILVRHFADADEMVRDECSEAVAKMGNVALPFLENLVTHNDDGVRIAALRALGGIGDPSGIPFSTKALNDPENPVRSQAMDSLVRISGFMFNFLMNEIQRVSIQGTKMEKLGMLSVLSKLQDAKIIPVVKRFLDDDDEEVRRNATEILEIYRTREFKKEKERVREVSRQTADLLKRKLSISEIDRLLDRLIGADDKETMEILGNKLSQEEINALIMELAGSKRETSKILGNKLSQEEIDELLHRSAYVSNKNTTKLLGNKLSQEEIDDLIHRASSKEEENAAKDIKKQLTQNEIDELIKKELALKKKVAMEVSRLTIGLKSREEPVRKDAESGIIKIGEPAVEPLMSFMANAEPEFQGEVAGILVKIGKPGIRGMIRTLSYGKTEMRIVIAKSILKSGDEEAVNAVYDRIRSEKNPDVKKALLLAFVRDTRDKRIPDALRFALADKDAGVKALAIRLLGKIKDERAIAPLVSVFSYSEEGLAALAADSISAYGIKALPVLTKELKGGGSDQFRERVADTIEKMQLKLTDKDDLIWFYAAKGRWKDLENYGEAAIGPLSVTAADPYSAKRAPALKTIISIGGKEAVIPLTKALSDIDGEISGMAREGLLGMGEQAILWLKKIAAGKTGQENRKEIESVIEEIRQKDLISNAIRTGDWTALADAGPEAIRIISQKAGSADPKTRREMASVIARIGGMEAVAPLSDMLFDSDEEISRIARHGLLNIGADAIPGIEKIHAGTLNPARKEALGFLKKEIARESEITSLVENQRWGELELMGVDAIDMISQLLEDPDPGKRMDAVKAVAGIDDIKSVRPLLHSLFDKDEKISDTARSALLRRKKMIIPVISVAIMKERNPERKKILSALIRDLESQD